jgi:CheY-like chemotaxis protein
MSEKTNSILIVEDSELNIEIISAILGDGYILYVARTGQEGIDMAKSLLPDLILLDIVLPGIDGYEVIKILKETPETKDIPIIFVTSLNTTDDERKGLLLGADDYINKPYDPIIVKLRVGVQLRMVNQLRTIRILSEEIDSWMKGNRD